MAIQKFKTFSEAEKAIWNFSPDSDYYKNIRSFYRLFAKLSKFSYPKGVHKFRNLEEAEEHKMNVILNSAINKS